MKKTLYGNVFNPYWRYEEAVKLCKDSKACGSRDLWVRKLCSILKLRDKYRKRYKQNASIKFSEKYPLYASLLDAFEDSSIGGSRDLLEAALLCSADVAEIAAKIDNDKYDSLFFGLYKQLFFDVSKVRGNRIAEFQCFIVPMLSADAKKMAMGHIWKLLALTGGLNLLVRKGLGTEALGGEDVDHLLQLAAFRHCSELLKYCSGGSDVFKENPIAASVLTTFSDLQAVRSRGRRSDWLAQVKDVVRNNINTLLSGSLKLLSAPVKEKLLMLGELDGQFCPDVKETLEITQHCTYPINDGEQKSDA